MTIEEILAIIESDPVTAMAALREKSVPVPAWGGKKGLVQEYDPKKHPVNNKAKYPDIVLKDGTIEEVTRVSLNFQQLAVKRMSELCCGIPPKRIYSPQDDPQREVTQWMERIYEKNRIDSVNIERTNMLFAGCEVMTLWYAVEQKTTAYGFDSPLKFRCRNFSPTLGDELYPLFDEYGDMVAMSVAYRRKKAGNTVSFFDTYTADRHIKWSTESGDWRVEEDEKTTITKIPAIYMYRPEPIWGSTSNLVYEMEWSLSRNGNYLRKNSKPLFVVCADNEIEFGQEKSEKKEFRSVLQYPKGSTVQYVTWPQAVDSTKYYVSELRNLYFTLLQLPDWSYEKMSQQALSGESRKQLFIDAKLKVMDESGRLLEFFDRETNVLRAMLKTATPDKYHKAIDDLPVEHEITPYEIGDEKETISNLMTANGNKPMITQRESVEMLGWSQDVDKTMEELEKQEQQSVFNAYE